jgi:ATP phosphoribosyltransferase regulatory subunit
MTILSERFGQKVRIDFSVIDDMRYYNGIVFKGFVKGIPTSVLSGGKYDGLMSRMGKSGGAIGFAVYIDLIDSLEDDDPEYDTDVFVLYKAESSLKAIAETVESCVKDGKKVQSGKTVPVGLRYKELIKL